MPYMSEFHRQIDALLAMAEALTSAAEDRQVGIHGAARNAAHDVHAEFQSLGMHVVGQRLEALAVGGGGKAIDGGDQAAVLRPC